MGILNPPLKELRSFYDNNENGGSSRWMITPDTLETWLKGKLIDIIDSIPIGATVTKKPDGNLNFDFTKNYIHHTIELQNWKDKLKGQINM